MNKLFLLLLTTCLVRAAGGPGYALLFNNTQKYVVVPHTNALNAYPLTVTAWFYAAQAGGPLSVDLVKKYDGTGNGWRLHISNDELFASYAVSGARYVGNGVEGINGGFWTDGLWHHAAFTVDASGGKLYVDGVLRNSSGWTGAAGAATTTQEMRLGGSLGPIFPLEFRLDEVTVWNVALSPAEVQTNKNRTLAGDEAGLLAYYRCDEGSGATTADSAPAGGLNDGSLFAVFFSSSDILPFTPFVQTLSVTVTGAVNATLNGVVNPEGTNTVGWFQWGTTTNYGSATLPQTLGSGSFNTNFDSFLSGLSAGGSYQFRAVASNAWGISYGTNQSFICPLFVNMGAGLPGVVRRANTLGYWQRSAAWGDYDNDGRLDIVISATNLTTLLWRNTGSGFSYAMGLPFTYSPLSWTDFNNDGRLDLADSGYVLRNTNGSFELVRIPFATPANYETSIGWTVWGDFDNDGRRDPLLSSYLAEISGNNFITATLLSSNRSAGFATMSNYLTRAAGPAAWGDFDNDGRLDFALTGYTNLNSLQGVAEIWRNTGSGFTNIQAGLPGVVDGSVAWGDYDNDGRLDLLLTGLLTNQTSIAQVWHNTGTGFFNIQAGLTGVFGGSGEWGDYDNDGQLDILLVGKTNGFMQSGGANCQLWRNSGAGFVPVPDFGPPGICGGTAAWGDYDNDGRLDILLVGFTNWFVGSFTEYATGAVSQVWRNLTPLSNTPPTAPGGLSVSLSNQTAIFSWTPAADMQTPGLDLSYNLRVGTTPGGMELVSALALPNGRLQTPEMGNAGLRLSRRINGLPLSTPLFWSVQAVDNGFLGSAFAPEKNFMFTTSFIPTNGMTVPGDVDGNGIVDQDELNAVLMNYFPHSPFLQMTNVAGLGSSNVTFALSNSTVGAFSVDYSTNLANWFFLGPAIPRYLFTDTSTLR